MRQGGILSPYLFCVYADELSRMLNNVNTGCFVGASLVNHLMYADDLVLLAPSAAGLSLLLSACSYYGIEFDVKYNSTKSNVMVFCCNLMTWLGNVNRSMLRAMRWCESFICVQKPSECLCLNRILHLIVHKCVMVQLLLGIVAKIMCCIQQCFSKNYLSA